jgi:hypothetical protein
MPCALFCRRMRRITTKELPVHVCSAGAKILVQKGQDKKIKLNKT